MGVARSRHGAHIAPVRAALVVLGVLVGIVVLAAAWFIRAPLPKLDGTIDAASLKSEVTIRRDDRGIPHIEASSVSDLFFGQGFACAQDRLWQMDLLRREAEGKLSELFGPVASLFRVKNVDDAIRVANDNRYGLGASAWTSIPNEQERFINELEVGMVFINQLVASDPRVPFGGVKRSGHGRELSVHGIREFMNIKTVWVK